MTAEYAASQIGCHISAIASVSNSAGHFVSETGKVYRVGIDGNLERQSLCLDGKGYYVFNRVNKGGIQLVHRAVAAAFIPEYKADLQVRHLDGNKLNNALANLAVGSDADNKSDTKGYGGRVGTQVFSNKDAMDIKARLLAGDRQVDIAKDYSVTRTCINYIAKGRSWAKNYESKYANAVESARHREETRLRSYGRL